MDIPGFVQYGLGMFSIIMRIVRHRGGFPWMVQDGHSVWIYSDTGVDVPGLIVGYPQTCVDVPGLSRMVAVYGYAQTQGSMGGLGLGI